jgi:phage baseplate assembly protein W
MAAERALFQGIGWAFPVGVEATTGQLALARYEESIRESILLIIGTAKGERLMRPTFGSRLRELVFAPIDTTTTALVSVEIRDALIDWEPRIQVIDVVCTRDVAEGNKLLVNVRYRVRLTNTVFNLVYPFYLQQGERE